MGQSATLGVDQAGVQEVQLGGVQQIHVARHVQADEHGIPIDETVVGLVGTAGHAHVVCYSSRQGLDVWDGFKVGLPKSLTPAYMVVMVSPDEEGLVKQSGVLDPCDHCVHLVGPDAIIFEIAVEDDQVGMQGPNLSERGSKVACFVLTVSCRGETEGGGAGCGGGFMRYDGRIGGSRSRRAVDAGIVDVIDSRLQVRPTMQIRPPAGIPSIEAEAVQGAGGDEITTVGLQLRQGELRPVPSRRCERLHEIDQPDFAIGCGENRAVTDDPLEGRIRIALAGTLHISGAMLPCNCDIHDLIQICRPGVPIQVRGVDHVVQVHVHFKQRRVCVGVDLVVDRSQVRNGVLAIRRGFPHWFMSGHDAQGPRFPPIEHRLDSLDITAVDGGIEWRLPATSSHISPLVRPDHDGDPGSGGGIIDVLPTGSRAVDRDGDDCSVDAQVVQGGVVCVCPYPIHQVIGHGPGGREWRQVFGKVGWGATRRYQDKKRHYKERE